jgi:hypothetical protein
LQQSQQLLRSVLFVVQGGVLGQLCFLDTTCVDDRLRNLGSLVLSVVLIEQVLVLFDNCILGRRARRGLLLGGGDGGRKFVFKHWRK